MAPDNSHAALWDPATWNLNARNRSYCLRRRVRLRPFAPPRSARGAERREALVLGSRRLKQRGRLLRQPRAWSALHPDGGKPSGLHLRRLRLTGRAFGPTSANPCLRKDGPVGRRQQAPCGDLVPGGAPWPPECEVTSLVRRRRANGGASPPPLPRPAFAAPRACSIFGRLRKTPLASKAMGL